MHDRRDSFFGEQVLWKGRPKAVVLPGIYVWGSRVAGVVSAVTTASAVVLSTTMGASVGGLLLFAAYMATLAIGLRWLPRVWRGEFEYIITDRSIVLRRGKLRRYIDRRAISYARIHWHPSLPGIGDLELVRAVPTGALRRKLSIVLCGLVAPDRVLSMIRGVEPQAASGDHDIPLAQRLDDGERVLWAARPGHGWRRFLPSGRRAVMSLAIGAVMALTAIGVVLRSVQSLQALVGAGLDPDSISFFALLAALSMTVFLLAGAGLGIIYWVMIRPARLDHKTRYLVTNRRVLIQRGDEELHLDRSRIVDVIDAPADGGRHDLFLVLDGPRARALASSGAFGEEDPGGLVPVFHLIQDAGAVLEILRSGGQDPEQTPLSVAA